MKTRIFIVGSGVVGAATGEGFLKAGHDVTFVDISPERVAQLSERGFDVRTEIDLPNDQDA
ncbi:MAG: 2-dehydropantoate 2-reductase N-terminal domain-containing protein, partial [Pseudonocardia sp.]